jgi:hypothetical protein
MFVGALACFACYCLFAIWNSGFDFGLLIPSTTPNLTADPAIYVVPEVEPLEPSEILNNNGNGEHTIHESLNEDIKAKSHASHKHSQEAQDVRKCLNDFGSIHIYFNPSTGRYANICLMPDRKYGLQIAEDIGNGMEEVTSFVKSKLGRWEQMAKYLENGGYTNMIK